MLSEVVGGEAVVIHLSTGRYYALDAAATAVWELALGRNDEELADALQARPGIRAAAPAVVRRWHAEDLLVADESATPQSLVADLPDDADPDFRAFDDLADLLLVDPIHDVTVDGEGFPVRRIASTPNDGG